MGGLMEMRDLSQDSGPIYSFQIPHEQDESLMHIVDLDLKYDEKNLLIAFSGHKVAWLNLQTS